MAKKTILFLGTKTENIMKDAEKEGLLYNPIILTRRNDKLPVPAGVTAMAADEFVPQNGTEYIFIANGGTTEQVLPVFAKLLLAAQDKPFVHPEEGCLLYDYADISLEVYNLQWDGITKIWPLGYSQT